MDFTDLNESMGAFEGAVSSNRARVIMPTVGTILLAIDGSDQDPTAVAIAAEMAPLLRAGIRVTMGAEGPVGDAQRAAVQRTIEHLKSQHGLDALPIFEEGKWPAQQILAAKKAANAGIIVVPAPYLQDFEALGNESLSSPIDVLLAESRVPVLLVRQPLEQPALCFQRFVLPMTIYAPALASAAGWAFSLARKDSNIELYAMADTTTIEEATRLAGGGDDAEAEARSAAVLLRAEQKNASGMISAMQKKAEETGIEVTVDVEAGDTLALTLEHMKRAPCMAVLGAPLDRASHTYHHAQDVALNAKYPVLIVHG